MQKFCSLCLLFLLPGCILKDSPERSEVKSTDDIVTLVTAVGDRVNRTNSFITMGAKLGFLSNHLCIGTLPDGGAKNFELDQYCPAGTVTQYIGRNSTTMEIETTVGEWFTAFLLTSGNDKNYNLRCLNIATDEMIDCFFPDGDDGFHINENSLHRKSITKDEPVIETFNWETQGGTTATGMPDNSVLAAVPIPIVTTTDFSGNDKLDDKYIVNRCASVAKDKLFEDKIDDVKDEIIN